MSEYNVRSEDFSHDRHVTPLILGLGSVLAPLGFILIPEAHQQSRIFQHIGYFSLFWHVFLIIGGVMILYGWWKRRIDIEAAGYVMSSTGAFFYTIALFTIAGWGAWFSALLIGSLAGGEISRAWAAIRGRVVS